MFGPVAREVSVRITARDSVNSRRARVGSDGIARLRPVIRCRHRGHPLWERTLAGARNTSPLGRSSISTSARCSHGENDLVSWIVLSSDVQLWIREDLPTHLCGDNFLVTMPDIPPMTERFSKAPGPFSVELITRLDLSSHPRHDRTSDDLVCVVDVKMDG